MVEHFITNIGDWATQEKDQEVANNGKDYQHMDQNKS